MLSEVIRHWNSWLPVQDLFIIRVVILWNRRPLYRRELSENCESKTCLAIKRWEVEEYSHKIHVPWHPCCGNSNISDTVRFHEATLDSTAGVLERRNSDRDTVTDTQESLVWRQRKRSRLYWNGEVFGSRWGLGEARKIPSLEPSGEEQFCWHLSLRLWVQECGE